MKVTLNEIRGMQKGLNTVMRMELPAKTAYWFKRFMDRVVSEMKAIEKTRLTLAVKYAKKDKDGKPLFKKDKKGKQLNEYDVTPDNLLKFGKEFEALCQKEFEIPFTPIKLDAFGDTKITPDTLYELGKLIEE